MFGTFFARAAFFIFVFVVEEEAMRRNERDVPGIRGAEETKAVQYADEI